MICAACGYKEIEEGEHRCPRCGRRTDRPDRVSAAPLFPPLPPEIPAAAVSGSLPGAAAAAVAPQWKHELTERLERFQQKRAQRGTTPGELSPDADDEKSETVPPPDPNQKVLAFEDFAAERIEPLIVEPPKLPPLKPARASGTREPLQPPVPPRPRHEVPHELFTLEGAVPDDLLPREALCPSPVAPLLLRGLAGALDLAVLTVAVGLFFGTFHLLGGVLPFNQKAGGAMALATAALFTFYFFLYICYATETPGLQWMGLRLIDFEGNPPRAGRRFVRAVGMLLSGLSLGLGYLWALADEESLTWHDRMSKTFVTRDPAGRQYHRA